MTTAAAVAMIAISILVCYIFAGIITELLMASLAAVLPAPARKRSMRWRYVLFGIIGVASLACPVAAVLFHSVLIWSLMLQCMSGASFGVTVIAYLQGRLSRAAND